MYRLVRKLLLYVCELTAERGLGVVKSSVLGT